MPARVYDDQLMEFPDDPLARALLPPRNEKPAAREARLHAEREAKKRSDMIDEDISRQRAEDRKGMKPVKILLLGQSESGKSTTLKNFQLMNSRQAFSAERETWRTVIQLNLVRSIHIILDTLTDVLAAQTDPRLPRRSSTYSDPRRSYPSSVDSTSALASAHAVLTIRPPSPSRSGRPGTARTIDSTLDGAGHMTEWDASTLTTGPSLSSSSGPRLTPEHVKLRTRLAALLPIEDDLRRRFAVAEPDLLGAAVTTPTVPAAGSKGSDGALSPPSAPPPAQPAKRPRPRTGTITRSSARKGEGSSGSRPSTAGSSRSSGSGGNNTNASGGLAPLNTNLPFLRDARAPKELAVLSAHGWKSAIGRMMAAGGGVNSVREVKGEVMGADPGRMLAACAEDIKALWGDPVVRAVLAERKVRVEEMSGFFLDSLDRVTSPSYVPTDDDILRARLKTLGVSEYRFTFKASHSMYHDWRVYDVGGQRSLRAAWVPFFDDMDGIIFLAPVSCFDQVLEEDENVNRIEDSVLLWKSIVSNPLLAKTNLVLFLNKCDILKKKLDSGTRFAKYVLSYGDRPNDFESVAKYLKRKFSGLLRDCSPEPRQFYCHLTSVIDTKTTFTILESVQDMVVRANLKASHLVD